MWATPESSPRATLVYNPTSSARGAPTFAQEPGDEASGEVWQEASTAKILGLTLVTGWVSFRESPESCRSWVLYHGS